MPAPQRQDTHDRAVAVDESGNWRDAWILALVVLALVLLLRQRAFHGYDAQHVLGMVRDGSDANYSHPLYLPWMLRWHAWLAPLGLTPFQALRLASALGVALGALWLHRASVALGLPRTAARCATLLACAMPAVVFFGTVVELHGVFFAPMGLAFWLWARAVGSSMPKPGVGRFVVLGVATAVASGVHTSGHFLLWLLPALAWGLGRWPGLRKFGATLAAHALLTFVIGRCTADAAGASGSMREMIDSAIAYWGPRVPWLPHEVLAVFWREWGLPFLPLSLATLAALGVAARRRLALGLLLGIAPLLGLSWLLLHRELDERGAYLLPFAWPAAVLVVGWWPRRAQVAAIVGALALAIGQVAWHDRARDDPNWTRVLRPAVGTDRALVICFTAAEVNQTLRDIPAAVPRPIHALAEAILRGYEGLCAEFDAWVAPYLDAGHAVWITPEAMKLLDAMATPEVRRFRQEHLAQRYRVEPFADAGFPVVRVQRR